MHFLKTLFNRSTNTNRSREEVCKRLNFEHLDKRYALNADPTGSVTISGTPTEGELLTAEISTLADADGIGTITLNRPHRRNALTFAMYDLIKEICMRAGGSDDADKLRVLIFKGGGDAAFAAGTDISQFKSFSRPEDAINYETMIEAVLQAIEQCQIPTIAALNGFVTGGGAAIAAACSIHIGSHSVKLGVPIAKTLGNCLAIANLRRFVQLVGPARTAHILLTSQLIDAEAALQAGFITELHEAGDLQAIIDSAEIADEA